VGREYFIDKTRETKTSKVTDGVELSILALRITFKWGTVRIQQGLHGLPGFIMDAVRAQPYKVEPKFSMFFSFSSCTCGGSVQKNDNSSLVFSEILCGLLSSISYGLD
jgi:hypothetical protein